MTSTSRSYGSSSAGTSVSTVVDDQNDDHISYQDLPFECTYGNCQHRFETLKEMQRHKAADPDHFYCKKCDVDCTDWKDLTRHKVELMEPYIEGRISIRAEEPKHIVCEFCGDDFKSFGGRKRHRAMMHPADQDIKCPGCPSLFLRASALVAHLELGKCDGISQQEFESGVQHKWIIGDVSKAKAIEENLAQNRMLSAPNAVPRLIENGSSTTDDEDEGGVSLLDVDDDAQRDGIQPLQAEVDLMDTTTSLRGNDEVSPHLPGREQSRVETSMRALSITSSSVASGAESVTGTNVTKGRNRQRARQVYTESCTPLNATRHASCNSIVSRPGTANSHAESQSSAWTTGATSNALFPYVRPPPEAGDWPGILTRAQEDAAADERQNLLKIHWWDPDSPDYEVDRFYNELTQTYLCPFPGCTVSHHAAADLERHMQGVHRKTKWTCPTCLKVFRFKHAFVAHSEGSADCKVRFSASYGQILNTVSGGVLSAQNLGEVKIYNVNETALIKAGDQPVNGGVMSTRYTASMTD